MNQQRYPQIKVCGLTRPDEAVACAELGADAIGLVFYPDSPRNVTLEQAAAIVEKLPSDVSPVGVFVNPDTEMLIQAITQCGLQGIQLHGAEPPEFTLALEKITQAKIYKALFTARAPGLNDAGNYNVAGFLIECGRGRLPGGNAETWDWSLAEPFGRTYPLILAGGLDPKTVCQAIQSGLPDAVDASSGLEASPGRKDLAKVEHYIHAVHQAADAYTVKNRTIRPIF